MKYYGTDFYKSVETGALSSADAILPIAEELISPKSVIDIGCGNGAWLSYFFKKGIKIKGIDGDYVDRRILKIPEEYFMPYDLTKPLVLNEKFDMAMSFEVAEHLEEKYADTFIDTLTGLSDIVLFSAALPMARSASHVNEQWQSYWAVKFADRGYKKIDCIRPEVWSRPAIEWWYVQGILIYANDTALEKNHKLKQKYELTKDNITDIVHPRFMIERAAPENYYLTDIFKAMPVILKKIFERKFRK